MMLPGISIEKPTPLPLVWRCPWVVNHETSESCGRPISKNKRLCKRHQDELDAAKAAFQEKQLARERELAEQAAREWQEKQHVAESAD